MGLSPDSDSIINSKQLELHIIHVFKRLTLKAQWCESADLNN